MATHAFPAPPDLSELLKFFATLSYDQHGHPGTQQQQQSPTRRRRDTAELQSSTRQLRSSGSFQSSSQQQRPSSSRDRISTTQDPRTRTQPSTSQRRRDSPPKNPAGLPPPPPPQQQQQQRATHDWNGSTQIPVTIAKPLKHQILDRTYQPPAPVVVDASGTTHLVKRLSKTTVSSRLKRHQADEEAALAAATTALSSAFERRSHRHRHHHHSRTTKHHADRDYETNAKSDDVLPPSPPDSRARDSVQTLLMYRREVEKRLSMDPTHFPAPPLGDHYGN
ncbi:hypothetical protein Gpo141_00002711 [Globisporangium polare]